MINYDQNKQEIKKKRIFLSDALLRHGLRTTHQVLNATGRFKNAVW